jgi:hypothetical protein
MSSLVTVSTDKPQYKKGETVQIKIRNDSDKVVNFIDAGFGLEINHQDNSISTINLDVISR